ncbi:hypothetical protein ES705_17364 [subsurface metagenome]
MINENIHYRLPLKLINSHNWATLGKPARAILPVIGIYANREGKAWPGVRIIAELAGYKDKRCIRLGMEDLIKNKLVIREKLGRHYIYSLTDLAIWKWGRSFFPIYKEAMILSRKWAGLTPSEKSLYPVLGNKAKINNPEVLDSGFHAIGDIYEPKKYIEWAGICPQSFYSAYYSLNHKDLIDSLDEGEGYYRYGIYVPQ